MIKTRSIPIPEITTMPILSIIYKPYNQETTKIDKTTYIFAV